MEFFAQPLRVTVVDARTVLMEVYKLAETDVLELFKKIEKPLMISKFPDTYCVHLKDGIITSSLKAVYGEEDTLALIRHLRKSDPESFK